MDVDVMMQELTERVDGCHHAGHYVVSAQDGAVHLQHRLPGEPWELTEQTPVEAEEDAQSSGQGEDELAVGHRLAEVLGDVRSHDQGALLVTARAHTPPAAGEGDEHLMVAVGAADAGKALVEVTTGEELLDGLGDDGPPEAEALLVAFVDVWSPALAW
jgi:hypothetical protein